MDYSVLTEMTSEVFHKLNSLIFFLLPKFHVAVLAGGEDEVSPGQGAYLQQFYLKAQTHRMLTF